jgi:hypothetical protein
MIGDLTDPLLRFQVLLLYRVLHNQWINVSLHCANSSDHEVLSPPHDHPSHNALWALPPTEPVYPSYRQIHFRPIQMHSESRLIYAFYRVFLQGYKTGNKATSPPLLAIPYLVSTYFSVGITSFQVR